MAIFAGNRPGRFAKRRAKSSGLTVRVIAVVLILLFIFLGWTFFWLLYDERQTLVAARSETLREQVQLARSLCLQFDETAYTGRLNRAQAISDGRTLISGLRFGPQNQDALYVLSKDGTIVFHPLRPESAGRNIMELVDEGSRPFFLNVLGSNYVADGTPHRVRWLTEPGAVAALSRLAYAEHFDKWNWIIVGEMGTSDINNFVLREISGQVPILIILTLLLSYVMISTLRRLVLSDIDGLIAVATEMQGGQLSARARVRPSDELGKLATAFNTMASGIQDRDEEIRLAQRATVYALAKLADSRDSETGGHLLRVREYSRVLAEELRQRSAYWEDIIDDQFVEDLSDAVMLHDIGKVGIPDYILLKPELLSEAEMAIMMSHTLIGANTIRTAQERMKSHSGFLALAEEITRSHHERWDGNGYLERLAGDDIPPAARIFSVADVYDALTTERAYKKAYSHQDAIEMMRKDSGKRFDPTVFDAFLSLEREFNHIREEFAN